MTQSTNDKKSNKPVIIVVIIVAIIVIAAAIVFITSANKKAEEAETTTTYTAQEDDDFGTTITYNGEKYKLDQNKSTILFMGVDAGDQGEIVTDYGQGGRCDTIILFITDKSDNSIQMLEMSRNSMVDVDVYDNEGEELYSDTMQICLQYAYGDSFKRGNYLMKKKVSETLSDITIDDYISLQMDGIPKIVDALGGVTITMEEDCTAIDPAYTKGATVTMDGEAAESFVRYRGDEEGSNENTRMSNQAWFMKQLFSQMKGIGVSKISEIMDDAGDYLDTDMYADTMANFLKYNFNDEALTVPGEVKQEIYDEFWIDNEKLKGQIINLFYKKVEE